MIKNKTLATLVLALGIANTASSSLHEAKPNSPAMQGAKGAYANKSRYCMLNHLNLLIPCPLE